MTMTLIEPVNWNDLLLVYMHDPVDKALDLEDHEHRAARYASTALGRKIDRDEMTVAASLADQFALIAERLPVPTAGSNGERAVAPVNGVLTTRHPVDGQDREVRCGSLDEAAVSNVISKIVDGLETPRERFLALWRLLPERLEEEFGEWIVRLPADTCVPDHTLTNHADIASGIWASRRDTHGGAYLSFALGPVQPFIAAARSLRDLWTGSAILSWLAFKAMQPVLEVLGPTAFVYPALRGNPLMDLWLRNRVQLGCVSLPDSNARRSPSLPHRFVAVVPWGAEGNVADELAERCVNSAREAWARLADEVHKRLKTKLGAMSSDWDRLWSAQVADVFDLRTTVVPEHLLDNDKLARLFGRQSFDEVWPHAAKVRSLSNSIPAEDRPGYAQNNAGRWQAQLELAARAMEASRVIRHVPAVPADSVPDTCSPPKCSLFGSWEQMGPADFGSSSQFWDEAYQSLRLHGTAVRKGERLCAVALVKRFAGPALLASELGLEPAMLRFPDTATVAAADWLKRAGIDPDEVRSEYGSWSGRWLHDPKNPEEPSPPSMKSRISAGRQINDCRPPPYLALLKMDGDEIGGWLRGEKSPTVREVLHPDMTTYFEAISDPIIEGALSAHRPVGPALHASISSALGHFAAEVAPRIVHRYAGTVIYSGGDDLLALLPAERAVACAHELQCAFRGQPTDNEDSSTGMGKQVTASAGIAYVHHMEDLRLALQAVREAEKRAKADGRDTLRLHFMRRSGEHADAMLPWDLASWFSDLTERFRRGATDRWAYRLRAELPVLSDTALPKNAVSAEIRRLGNRIDDPLWKDPTAGDRPGDVLARWWCDYRDARARRDGHPENVLGDFVTLCQGAAFVARGRDD